jgi:Leucine-rich repeat (LRR) protein
VRHLSNLEKLQLRRTKITDDGIRCLTGLARLQYLDLSETPITDGFEVAHFSAVAGGVRRLRHLPFL